LKSVTRDSGLIVFIVEQARLIFVCRVPRRSRVQGEQEKESNPVNKTIALRQLHHQLPLEAGGSPHHFSANASGKRTGGGIRAFLERVRVLIHPPRFAYNFFPTNELGLDLRSKNAPVVLGKENWALAVRYDDARS